MTSTNEYIIFTFISIISLVNSPKSFHRICGLAFVVALRVCDLWPLEASVGETHKHYIQIKVILTRISRINVFVSFFISL